MICGLRGRLISEVETPRSSPGQGKLAPYALRTCHPGSTAVQQKKTTRAYCFDDYSKNNGFGLTQNGDSTISLLTARAGFDWLG